MSHQSDNCHRLEVRTRELVALDGLPTADQQPSVTMLCLPAGRSDDDAALSALAYQRIAAYCARLHPESTVCLLTSSPDAARLLPYLEKLLKYQLWIAVKIRADAGAENDGQLPARHAALLVLTRYRTSLRHTVTRIGYTFCPACGKSTKDYGGKKHTYNPYGTLMSDVWRDIEYHPQDDIGWVVDRLQDLFGLSPYQYLEVLDLRDCSELQPQPVVKRARKLGADVSRSSPVPLLESQLLNGDCLEVLKGIPNESVDFCFADPPYNIRKKYDHWNDALEMQHYFEWCDQWLSELTRVLKPGRTLAVINLPLWAVRHYQHLCRELAFQSWIAWEGLSLPVRMIMPAHYAILCFSKGPPRDLPGCAKGFAETEEGRQAQPLAEFFCLRASCVRQRQRHKRQDRDRITDLWHDIHRLKHNSRRVDHPCQLPPALMRRLFSLFTHPDELVLDCFDGAGTSSLVAHQMGRRFVGIELSLQYHTLAKERHELVDLGRDPFAKQDAVPQAKNSRVERLPKQKYVVSKKVLQLDIRRIAAELGRVPSRDEVSVLSSFPMKYFDEYFISWGEACAAARHAGMSELQEEMPHNPDPQLVLF